MEVFTKKFKNVEDRILIDTTISFLKNKMKSNTLIDTGATISCISNYKLHIKKCGKNIKTSTNRC